MWLLKTPPRTGIPSTLELHQRQSSQEPYAILSHTWGPLKDEILFEDLIRYCDRTIRQNEGYISVDYRLEPGVSLRNKPGWLKVEASIKQARADGYGWVWADTCCIDKSSSAELSEAINSMYAWYETSAVCYAFLADVSSKDPDEVRRNNFYASRWFTRGWTLQELIAVCLLNYLETEHLLSNNVLRFSVAEFSGVLQPGVVAFGQQTVTRIRFDSHHQD